jgi:acetolactate synthase I/II/III large subunit
VKLETSGPRSRFVRVHPDSMVFSLNGDGDFLMSSQEFARVAQYELLIVIAARDNSC